MPTLKTINDLTATAIDDNTSLELQPAAAAGTSKATVATLFGGTGNRALITRIPGEGANVIPVIGSGVVLDANTPQPRRRRRLCRSCFRRPSPAPARNSWR